MKKRASAGFTLVELLVAITLGLLVLGVGVVLYRQALNSTTYLTQHTSVQGNARAAMNQINQDLSLAGYGLPIGGVAVPSAALFSCSTGGASYAYDCPGTTPSFPVINSQATLTGIMPGSQVGITLNGAKTDQITIAYVDSAPNFYVDNPVGSTGSAVVAGFDAQPLVSAAVSGSSTTLTFNSANTYPPINDPKWGFHAGDLVLVSNSTGAAVGEVTATPTGATTLTLGAGDTMRLNQAFGTVGSVPNVLGFGSGTEAYNNGAGPLPATTVDRLYLVTYYVQYDPLAESAGTTALSPRLYRLVNGDSTNNAPVPVAEQISNLQFFYNLFNVQCGGSQVAGQETLTATTQIPLIVTVNTSLTSASTLGTIAVPGQKIQQVPLTTTVSPRNLSFFNTYSSTSTTTCS